MKTNEIENKIKNHETIEVQFLHKKQYLNSLLEKAKLTPSKIGSDLGIGNTVYEMASFNQDKKHSRDKLLAVLIYIKCSLKEIETCLQLFGHSKLYVRESRDKLIYEAIVHHKGLDEINEMLHKSNFEIIK